MAFVVKNLFAPLANDEPDQSEVSNTSAPSSEPPGNCPDALVVHQKKKKKRKKRKKNKQASSATLNPGALHYTNKVNVLETTNLAGPSVQIHYLLNDGERPKYQTREEGERDTTDRRNPPFQSVLDSPEDLYNSKDTESERNSLKTSIQEHNSPTPMRSLLNDNVSVRESHEPFKEESQHERLRNTQPHQPQQTEEEAPQHRRLNSLLRALDRADEDTFWMGSRNERSNSGIRPRSPPPYDQPSMTFVSHESGSQDIYVGHGCTVNAGQSTTVYAHSGCIVFAGYGSTIINDNATTHTATENAIAVSPSETVRIKHGLDFADQEGWKDVRRHLPIEDLKSIPEIQEIKDNFAPVGNRVAVKSNYEQLMQGIRDEWKVERERVIDETLKKMRREEDQLHLEERRATVLLICRHFEDFVFARFALALGVEMKDQSHGRLIDLFRAQFRIEEFTDEDYDHLRTSSKRKDANDVAHLEPNTTETRIFRDILYDYLRRFGDTGELQRFQKYYKFVVGEYGFTKR